MKIAKSLAKVLVTLLFLFIIYKLARTYNDLVYGNLFTLILAVLIVPVLCLGTFLYLIINKFNREAGIVTWWSLIRVGSVIIATTTLPIIFTMISGFCNNLGLLTISKILFALRFWSVLLVPLGIYFYKLSPRAIAKFSRHFLHRTVDKE